MISEIRDFDKWDWSYIDEDYSGVTLKHVFDIMISHTQVKFEKECPTPFAESYFKEFNSRGHNQIDKIDPEDGFPMPDHFKEWHRDISFNEYKTLPYKHNLVVDLHHIPYDPIPL